MASMRDAVPGKRVLQYGPFLSFPAPHRAHKTNNDEHHRDDQKNVYKPADGIHADNAEEPEK